MICLTRSILLLSFRAGLRTSLSALLRVVLLNLFLICAPVSAANDDPFILELESELRTIGDIKPSFIVYQDKPLPKVSIDYIVKRYIKLFENADSPTVKIDALNRIKRLTTKYKLKKRKLIIDESTESKALLEGYDQIERGDIVYHRPDELLYQTAKAALYLGDDEEAIKRLKLLVGLHPKSPLVDESMFRIAEMYFDLEEFNKAEAHYKKVLVFSKDAKFHHRAHFKLAWAVFRQDRFAEAAVHASKVLDVYPELRYALDLESLELKEKDLINDTFRLYSTMFSQDKSGESLEVLQESIGHKEYAFLLYDALFNFHLSQERYRDAGLVARQYTEIYSSNFNAYVMAQNEIETYKRGNFDIQVWEAKENFAKSFGVNSEYWVGITNEQKDAVRPYLVEVLGELAHLYFIRMQTAIEKNKLAKNESADISIASSSYYLFGDQAADYYEELVETRGEDRHNGEDLYLAGEAAFNIGDYRRAIELYERSAYGVISHIKAVNAGYASILVYEHLKVDAGSGSSQLSVEDNLARRATIERFAQAFPMAKQTPELLNDIANQYYNEENLSKTIELATRVVQHRSAPSDVLYSSWLVKAHSHFALEQYPMAEIAYQKLLEFNKGTNVEVLRERLAASIYKQAEQESQVQRSAELYLKVVDLVPDASFVPQALYDASSQFLQLKNWSQAIATLNVFQERFPQNKLYSNASEKLVYAYLENQDPIPAAEKLIEISNASPDKLEASNALYRASEIYLENEFNYEAVGLLETFTKRYPEQFELNIEAYHQNIVYFDGRNNKKKADAWRSRLIKYEQDKRSQRTPRSAYLASNAALSLIDDDVTEFEEVSLALPLKKSLAKKTKKLKKLVSKLEGLADYEVAEVISAATFKIASVYRTLAQDIMNSERPDKLTELQLEQYDILLEEQAYSFEEQALEIFEVNIEKVSDGEFDKWISATYNALAEMNPTEFDRKPKVVLQADEFF